MLAKLRTTELKQQRKRWFVLVLIPTENKIYDRIKCVSDFLDSYCSAFHFRIVLSLFPRIAVAVS